jgi:hypothetical protein
MEMTIDHPPTELIQFAFAAVEAALAGVGETTARDAT